MSPELIYFFGLITPIASRFLMVYLLPAVLTLSAGWLVSKGARHIKKLWDVHGRARLAALYSKIKIKLLKANTGENDA